jgi:hypothetical protein
MRNEELTNAAKPSLKERATHELRQYLIISAYLAVLFGSVAIYTNLLIRHHGIEDSPLTLTFILIKALVLGKVILVGEMVRLGRRVERLPLYQSIVVKSLLFGLLIFLFHIIEEFVRSIFNREGTSAVLHESTLETLAARSIVVIVALIPLFAYREIDRVLGESRLRAMLFKRHP